MWKMIRPPLSFVSPEPYGQENLHSHSREDMDLMGASEIDPPPCLLFRPLDLPPSNVLVPQPEPQLDLPSSQAHDYDVRQFPPSTNLGSGFHRLGDVGARRQAFSSVRRRTGEDNLQSHNNNTAGGNPQFFQQEKVVNYEKRAVFGAKPTPGPGQNYELTVLRAGPQPDRADRQVPTTHDSSSYRTSTRI